jgi:hypothetical protein
LKQEQRCKVRVAEQNIRFSKTEFWVGQGLAERVVLGFKSTLRFELCPVRRRVPQEEMIMVVAKHDYKLGS